MITRSEKKLIHIYAHAAGITEREYRALLVEASGKESSADMEFNHADADRVLAALEALLFDRVARAVVQDPRGRSPWIKDEYHFRKKASGPGAATSRQRWKIDALWSQLCDFLRPGDQRLDYLSRIIAKSVGRPTPLDLLTTSQAAAVIEALQDRLRHAIQSPAV